MPKKAPYAALFLKLERLTIAKDVHACLAEPMTIGGAALNRVQIPAIYHFLT